MPIIAAELVAPVEPDGLAGVVELALGESLGLTDRDVLPKVADVAAEVASLADPPGSPAGPQAGVSASAAARNVIRAGNRHVRISKARPAAAFG